MIHIHSHDNVAVAITDLSAGDTRIVERHPVTLRENISRGHKVALTPIQRGDMVIKYGYNKYTCMHLIKVT